MHAIPPSWRPQASIQYILRVHCSYDARLGSRKSTTVLYSGSSHQRLMRNIRRGRVDQRAPLDAHPSPWSFSSVYQKQPLVLKVPVVIQLVLNVHQRHLHKPRHPLLLCGSPFLPSLPGLIPALPCC